MTTVSLYFCLGTILINALSSDKAETWIEEKSSLLHSSLSTLISSVCLSFKVNASILVPYAFNLHPQLSVPPSVATQHTMETTSELLKDLNFFLVDYESTCLPAHPVLTTLILQTVFQSHGGKLQSFVDFTNLDTIFALSGIVIYSVLLEYQSSIHHPADFGVEFCTKFNECKQKLSETRDQVAHEELHKLQSDLVARGKCM